MNICTSNLNDNLNAVCDIYHFLQAFFLNYLLSLIHIQSLIVNRFIIGNNIWAVYLSFQESEFKE